MYSSRSGSEAAAAAAAVSSSSISAKLAVVRTAGRRFERRVEDDIIAAAGQRVGARGSGFGHMVRELEMMRIGRVGVVTSRTTLMTRALWPTAKRAFRQRAESANGGTSKDGESFHVHTPALVLVVAVFKGSKTYRSDVDCSAAVDGGGRR